MSDLGNFEMNFYIDFGFVLALYSKKRLFASVHMGS